MTLIKFPLEKILNTSLGDYLAFRKDKKNLINDENYHLHSISIQRFEPLSYNLEKENILAEFQNHVSICTEVVVDYKVIISTKFLGTTYIASGVALIPNVKENN